MRASQTGRYQWKYFKCPARYFYEARFGRFNKNLVGTTFQTKGREKQNHLLMRYERSEICPQAIWLYALLLACPSIRLERMLSLQTWTFVVFIF